MRRFLLFTALIATLAGSVSAQAISHLSPAEVNAALVGPSAPGVAVIIQQRWLNCTAQQAALIVFTPQGLLRQLNAAAKKQYLPFNPRPEDTLDALTVVSHGCALGSASGPLCESVTRAVLLSDKAGTVVVPAIISRPVEQSWQNGFGATAGCSSLISKFAMSDVKKVQNEKGEFLVATFDGTTLLKIYKVKQKYIKDLGLQ